MNNYIKKLIDSKKMSQKELASVLGISPAAVNQWADTKSISLPIIYKISKLFSVSVDNLLNERFQDETDVERFNRLYNVSKYDFAKIVEEKNVKDLLCYSEKLRNINERAYDLLYKSFIQKISVSEKEELDYIKNFLRCNTYKSKDGQRHYFNYFNDEEKEIEIRKIINDNIGIDNKDAFIWELKKIYYIGNKIDWQKDIMATCEKTYGLFSYEILRNIILSYPEIERDAITAMYLEQANLDATNLLYSFGCNSLYDFTNVSTYDEDVFNSLEGEKVHLTELDEAYSLLAEVDNDVKLLGYNEYKKMIDKTLMERIKNYCEYERKKSNPITCWERIKKNLYRI